MSAAFLFGMLVFGGLLMVLGILTPLVTWWGRRR